MKLSRTILVAAAASGALLTASPAAFGGGAIMDWGRRFYLPGETATAHTSVYFNPTSAGIGDGPYYAYLVTPSAHGRERFRWIGPRVAARRGTRIGRIHVTRRSAKYGDASMTFVVPDLPTGTYRVGYCTDPCRRRWLGDIVAIDPLRIETSRLQGFVRARVTDVRRSVLGRIDGVARRTERARHALLDQTASLEVVRARTLEVARSLARVEARQRRPDPFPLAEVILAAAAGVCLTLLAGRLRRKRSRLDRELRELRELASPPEIERQSVALGSSPR